MNVGALGSVGLAREVTWGTAVAPTIFIPFASEGFKDGPEALSELQIRGILDQSPKYAGTLMVSGSLSGVVLPDQIGHLLRAVLGIPTVTGVGPYTHTFNPTQSAWSALSALPSYTFTVVRPSASSLAGQVVQYSGMVCQSLSFKYAANGLLMFDSQWIGKDAASVAAPTVTLPTSTPFNTNCALSRGGGSDATIQDYNLSITNSLEGVKLIGTGNTISRVAFSGARTITIGGAADFQSLALYTAFKNFTQEAWSIVHTQGAHTLTFSVPKALITDAGVAIGGDGRITLSYSGEAQYDTGTSRAFQAQLVNSVASFN
ncbi:phage tail tube protein [Deinococcus peraridilitoris]|uniref:Uncharacterized protein n=1 Tax=Deinococcus peraridilitoris (strain DSM 19664 / LMG 22246 / CIP 109416 / KR-200) TaxID=937777 RepID=K9ZZB3_DEIPD|nr:phage tail tube protein [Deinococcus peraridilitoris]AFZ66983.1 hypothetical protein Deipe_1442 [Deinococcus peraridilitoris DSM 19664]